MKRLTLPLIAATCAAVLSSCATNREVTTKCLQDTLIAVAKEAKAAGVTELNYEGSVTTTTTGNVAVVIPVAGLSPTFGLVRSQAVASKVIVKIPVKETAEKNATNDIFKCNLSTLEAEKIAN